MERILIFSDQIAEMKEVLAEKCLRTLPFSRAEMTTGSEIAKSRQKFSKLSKNIWGDIARSVCRFLTVNLGFSFPASQTVRGSGIDFENSELDPVRNSY